MAKKPQAKHTRRAAQRRRSTPRKLWASPTSQTRPAIKISEAILTLAEPLLLGKEFDVIRSSYIWTVLASAPISFVFYLVKRTR